jgi:hypothetical protein
MANQVATAAISATSSASATAKAIHGCHASISAFATLTASASEKIKSSGVRTTGGFAGISVDPTAYVYAAAQAILAAVTNASSGTNYAQALLVSGPQPYVLINGVPGSNLQTTTGATSTILSANSMITAITGAVPPFPTFAVNLWSAVANYLQANPSLLVQDGFSTTRSVRSDGAQVLDIIL